MVEANVELFVTSMALILIPFVAYGAMWLLGRLVVGSSGGKAERKVPRNTPNGRVIPGTRRDEAD